MKSKTQLVKDGQLIVETPQVMYDSVIDNVINYVTSALSKRGISLNQYLQFMYQTMNEFKEIEKLLVGLNKMAEDYYQEKNYWGRRILYKLREKNYDK